MMVVVACGAKKLDSPARARDLYVGVYFKACLAYALTLTNAGNIFILSANYGLIGINDVIEPYDKKLGDPFSVTEFSLTEYVQFCGLLDEKVIVLGGGKYVGLCRKVWKKLEAPLEGKGGLGKQIAWMRSRTKELGASDEECPHGLIRPSQCVECIRQTPILSDKKTRRQTNGKNAE